MTAMAASTAAASTTPTTKKNSSSLSLFFLKCGCRSAKAVSVSASHPDMSATSRTGHTPSTKPETSSTDTIILTTTVTTTSTSHNEEDYSPSFSGLLRQLNELEQSVVSWDCRRRILSESVQTREEEDKAGLSSKVRAAGQIRRQRHQKHRPHRRTQSEGSDVGGRITGKMGESVAVVKETDDPLGDFRGSMLQMIVEKKIVSGEELRELLLRFLSLNSPSHHPLIVRAFADIWRDVFSAYGDDYGDPVLLLFPPAACYRPHRARLHRRNSYDGPHHRRH